MNLVLLETSGNQRYIFATNKLRENVGASELTYQIGTKCVLEVVEQETGKTIWIDNDNDGSQLRANLLNPTINPPIEDKDTQIEVVVATSGKAVLLVKEKPIAEKIISEVTKRALIEMPGLTVHGAIETVAEDLSNIHDAVSKVHRKLENLRYKIPSNQQRFLRLPHVEPCATSGLPASEIEFFDQFNKQEKKLKEVDRKAFSEATLAKRKIHKKATRIFELIESRVNENRTGEIYLLKNLDDWEKHFEKKLSWVSVIHADGNGLGEIFLKFKKYSKKDKSDYVRVYKKLSLALDECTISATITAINELVKVEGFCKTIKVENKETHQEEEKTVIPIIPIVLGGDDLTVLCDGEYALKFTHDFLAEFEKQTSENDIIKEIANNAFGVERLGICAGIAIVKPHYPFHQAYELAAQLLKSAKQVKTKIKHKHNGKEVSLPCSAMDFHILYDSSGVELKQIREKLTVEEKDGSQTYLYAKPYIVTKTSDLEKADEQDWLAPRTWNELETRVCAMSATEKDDESKRKLPNSQLHHIRESLYRGQKETDSEINLFKQRYKDNGFEALLCEQTVRNDKGEGKKSHSLFFGEKHGVDIDGHTTHFLDALDVVEFWKGFDCKKGKQKDNEAVAENSDNGGKQ